MKGQKKKAKKIVVSSSNSNSSSKRRKGLSILSVVGLGDGRTNGQTRGGSKFALGKGKLKGSGGGGGGLGGGKGSTKRVKKNSSNKMKRIEDDGEDKEVSGRERTMRRASG